MDKQEKIEKLLAMLGGKEIEFYEDCEPELANGDDGDGEFFKILLVTPDGLEMSDGDTWSYEDLSCEELDTVYEEALEQKVQLIVDELEEEFGNRFSQFDDCGIEDFFTERGYKIRFVDSGYDEGLYTGDEDDPEPNENGDCYLMYYSYDVSIEGKTVWLRIYYGDNSFKIGDYSLTIQ